MSAADGTVVGLNKIFDSGTPGTRWNLVFVSDGYQATELGQFATDAQDVVDALLATPPFDRPEIQCGINVYRLDVSSTEFGRRQAGMRERRARDATGARHLLRLRPSAPTARRSACCPAMSPLRAIRSKRRSPSGTRSSSSATTPSAAAPVARLPGPATAVRTGEKSRSTSSAIRYSAWPTNTTTADPTPLTTTSPTSRTSRRTATPRPASGLRS